MHASQAAVAGGFPPGYYPQAHGQFRPHGYPGPPMGTVGPNPSFQSMTSHWNLTSHTPSPLPTPIHTPTSNTRGSKQQQNQFGIPKPPKPPDKPLLPYMRYSRKMWEVLKEEGKKVWEVGKIIGQKWRELTEEEKQPYFDEYEREKAVYVEQMKVYHNSPLYKRWLEAKHQAEQAARESAALGGVALASSSSSSAASPQGEFGPPPPSVIAPPRQSAAEARMQMMQHEDEEDEYITMKQLAAVRFNRNHRLMAEVFSDVPVPDMRSVVTKSRVDMIKKQVHSLEVHQRKLEDELQQLDNSFIQRKRRFMDDSDRFRRELKRIHDNPPSSWRRVPVQLGAKDIPQPPPNARYKKL